MHIVICEDDEAQALVLKKYFHEYQSTHPSDSISFFSSGEELLQSIDRNPTIHFAFLDIELPGISGLELADILAQAVSLSFDYIHHKPSGIHQHCLQTAPRPISAETYPIAKSICSYEIPAA